MSKNPSAVELGKMTSERKALAARINGTLGGRPKRKRQCEKHEYPMGPCGEHCTFCEDCIHEEDLQIPVPA